MARWTALASCVANDPSSTRKEVMENGAGGAGFGAHSGGGTHGPAQPAAIAHPAANPQRREIGDDSIVTRQSRIVTAT
jgi:hypothetical protein